MSLSSAKIESGIKSLYKNEYGVQQAGKATPVGPTSIYAGSMSVFTSTNGFEDTQKSVFVQSVATAVASVITPFVALGEGYKNPSAWSRFV